MPDLHCHATQVESAARRPRRRGAGGLALALGAVLAALAGCASGPASLADDRLAYNEVVKVTAEQQMLLNIVRLRYTDTPSSLAISSIATQTERTRSLQLVPFFGVVGGEAQLRGGQALLPGAAISTVERPTITLTPQDDTEFTRKLFTPMTLDGVLYLAKTTWPISTVFRLWLENLNWVSNAETASGPTSSDVPEFGRFVDGVEALQALQDKGMIVFGTREREEVVGGPIAAARVAGKDVVDAAREGLEYRPDPGGATWSLIRRLPQPVVRVHPNAAGTPEMKALAEAFRIRIGPRSYDIGFESLDRFPATYPAQGVDVFDLETRSLLQVLYFLSKGVEVPPAHQAQGVARTTRHPDGKPFDWTQVTRGLFRVRQSAAEQPPANAHVAIRYLGHWFSIERGDHDSLSTFSLVLELARLELSGKAAPGPALTLPLTGR